MRKETTIKANNNSPAIRFAGFADPWERRKLGEIVVIERGGSPRPIESYITNSPDGLNWIKIGDAPSQGKYITKTAEKIRREGLSKTRIVQPGDLILSNSMSFGKPYIMGICGCIHDGWLLIRNSQNAFNLHFLCHLLGSAQMLEQYGSLAAGSTVNNLNKELVGSAIVKYPRLTEQQKIGRLMEYIDSLITLHQQKYEKLVNLKKAMLDKMFPKNGELVPEVRFAGFSGNWERRKLGDMVQVRTGFPFNSRDFSSDGELLVITNGNIQDESDTVDISSGNRITVDNVKLRGEYELDEHDVLVTMDGNVGRTAKVSHHNLILAQRVGRLTARNNREYVYQSLNTGRFTEEMTVMSHGGTIKHISLTEIGGYVLDVPRQTEEQERIGTFLLKLDHLIKLQGRRLEHFLIIKSAFLEKMFV